MANIENIIRELGQQAKNASFLLASLPTDEKNRALNAMADALDQNRSQIKSANALDIKAGVEQKLANALIDRLKLDDAGIDGMIKSVREIAAQSDPIGKLITSKTLENGIELKKIRVPLGVVGIVFESRPNVMSDVAALAIKSGNAVILRGGKEAEQSIRAINEAISQGLNKVAFPKFAVQIVPVKDREAITYLCRLDEFVDVIIPRGGEGLIKAVADCATVPVIKHYKGVCHIFVDESADHEMALNIIKNAKCQRPSACNAVETILVHEKCANEFLPKVAAMFKAGGVEMRGDAKTLSIIPGIKTATEADWYAEYLDLIISVKIVKNIDDAIHHINTYGSHHSDAIISENKASQNQFVRDVDAAAVYVNASTRFTDGGMFGLGAEMGISTDKLHARGPMGAAELTTYKWIGIGNGQVRS